MNEIVLCKYCQNPEDKVIAAGLTCSQCEKFVHMTCLKRKSTPGGIYNDVFFTYICLECNSPNNEEMFERDKIKWFQVIMLALFDLAHNYQGTGRRGYYHWKTHIVAYIDKHWHILFPKDFKRRKNWTGTVSGTLSTYSPHFFQSGFHMFQEGGWWRPTLGHLSPEIITILGMEYLQIKQQCKKDDPSMQSQSNISILKQILEKYNLSFEQSFLETEIESPKVKDESLSESSENYFKDIIESSVNSGNLLPETEDEDSSSNINLKMDCIDPLGLEENETIDEKIDSELLNSTSKPAEEKWIVLPSLFNKNPFPVNLNPWEIIQNNSFSKNENIPLSIYEENELIIKLSNSPLIPSLQRLLAKLKLRKLKRAHNRTPFNIDILYKKLIANPKLVTKEKKHSRLDRYQANNFLLSKLKTDQDASCSFSSRLLGEVEEEMKSILSPYTNRILKPYIRRDFESKPTWLRLMNELKATVAKKKPNLVNESQNVPIDYCYVRPEHIPAINALCELFFWPGIDMSDSLQHPDFSCVVLYKKMIIAFAFLIPDVAYNESYISFIFTRPEWRRAGIATFMLYHLVQTCMGKDVTLHVSATNPAVILYQKFGFKIEEFVQDFYEKYMPTEGKSCKHALFLRLAR